MNIETAAVAITSASTTGATGRRRIVAGTEGLVGSLRDSSTDPTSGCIPRADVEGRHFSGQEDKHRVFP